MTIQITDISLESIVSYLSKSVIRELLLFLSKGFFIFGIMSAYGVLIPLSYSFHQSFGKVRHNSRIESWLGRM